MSEPVVIDPAKADVPSHVEPAADPKAASAPVDFAKLVPTEFADKPWVKEIKDVPGMFKRFDGLMTELGKRPAGIPHDNAKPEEVAAFNKAFGVPETADKYEFVMPEKNAMPEPMLKGVKELFHKAGLSAKQAKMVSEGWNALMGGIEQNSDAEFDKLAGEAFGDRKVEALKTSKVILEKFVPQNFKEHINNLGNRELIVLASVIDAIRKEYISEDQLPGGKGGSPALDAEAKRAKGRELMASEAYRNAFHPDHDRVKAEVNKLYGTA